MEDGANTDAEETVNEEKEEENKESKILAEIEQVLKKLGTEVKDIAGIIIVNSDGITVKSTLENSLSLQVNTSNYKKCFHELEFYNMQYNLGKSIFGFMV